MRYWEIIKAGQREADADKPDDHTEHQRWKRYWAKQQRINRALAAHAEQSSRGLPSSASALLSVPADHQPTGLPF